MNDLIKIDSMLDQAVCMVRENLKGVDQSKNEAILDELAKEHPTIGLVYHLGMLYLVRQDCEKESNE